MTRYEQVRRITEEAEEAQAKMTKLAADQTLHMFSMRQAIRARKPKQIDELRVIISVCHDLGMDAFIRMEEIQMEAERLLRDGGIIKR